MILDANYFYEQGQLHFEAKQYWLASDCFKKATELQKDFAEAWHYAGITLMKLQRQADGGIYLRRAEKEYSKRIAQDLHPDYNAYLKACVWALLDDVENVWQALQTAVNLNSEYAETALKEDVFEKYKEEDDFLAIVQQKIELLDALRYKGNKLAKSDLPETALANRQLFLDKFTENNWEVENFEALWEQNIRIAPQASAEYFANEHLIILLHYYLDEDLILMELQNRQFEEDVQAYRLYKKENIETLFHLIIAFQDHINEENWEDLIEALIEICDTVLFEMPDGRKVKVG